MSINNALTAPVDGAAAREDSCEARHPKLARFLDYWRRKAGARPFPARRDLDPLEFAELLGNVVICEVESSPLRFRYRLVGSNLAQRAGFDMTGKYVDEYPEPQYREFIRANFTEVVRARRPIAATRRRVLDDRSWAYEILMLPLSSDGLEVDMIIFALFYLDQY